MLCIQIWRAQNWGYTVKNQSGFELSAHAGTFSFFFNTQACAYTGSSNLKGL